MKLNAAKFGLEALIQAGSIEMDHVSCLSVSHPSFNFLVREPPSMSEPEETLTASWSADCSVSDNPWGLDGLLVHTRHVRL